jgi:hypothetical protein
MDKTTFKSSITPFTPPGTDITGKDEIAHSIGNVSFQETKSLEILSPYVEAYYNSHENKITINAIVYVDSKALNENGDLKFRLFQNTYLDLEGHPQLQFFIVYDMPEELLGELFIYEIIFNANSDVFIGGLSNVKTIETFLWDIDPVTSRGTETVVRQN